MVSRSSAVCILSSVSDCSQSIITNYCPFYIFQVTLSCSVRGKYVKRYSIRLNSMVVLLLVGVWARRRSTHQRATTWRALCSRRWSKADLISFFTLTFTLTWIQFIAVLLSRLTRNHFILLGLASLRYASFRLGWKLSLIIASIIQTVPTKLGWTTIAPHFLCYYVEQNGRQLNGKSRLSSYNMPLGNEILHMQLMRIMLLLMFCF